MGKGRRFSADKKVRLVGKEYDPEWNEVTFFVEVEDGCKTRLFRYFFDVERVLTEGSEMVLREEQKFFQ